MENRKKNVYQGQTELKVGLQKNPIEHLILMLKIKKKQKINKPSASSQKCMLLLSENEAEGRKTCTFFIHCT